MRERTGLYRLRDTADGLLYIGIANDPDDRWATHEAIQPWWPEVDQSRSTVQWFDRREDATQAEVEAIKRERPKYNRAHADYHPPLGVSVKHFREHAGTVLNDVAARGRTVYVTSRGRRIAAIVPLAVVEQEPEPK